MKIELHQEENEKTFFVKCNVCGHVLKDWIGSTPCCGSIAYECNEDGTNVSDKVNLYGFITSTENNEDARKNS